ncbi:MFS transporter [Pseudomonas sp. Root329]|uniref:MFS transporter n=1 Tax=Pseudomonas sp. Root329 TaxID=1736515 RepID=UPI0022A97C93|nr:MFS transporter [Pseudomonas sp. Root329]
MPSLPQIATDLSSSTAQVQHMISAFLAGSCLGMLFYGPLSDRYGRRPLLLGSLVLYGLATLGCLFAESIEQLTAWRFLQALGGAGALVLARAISRGSASRRARSQASSSPCPVSSSGGEHPMEETTHHTPQRRR